MHPYLTSIAALAATSLLTLGGLTTAAAPAGAGLPVASDVAAAARLSAADLRSSASEPRGAVTNHVLVISIDGLRPDAIQRYDAKTLQRLVSAGAATLEARTIYPSKTLPSHTSMLTGLEPTVHGVTWNTDQTAERGTIGAVTVFELARAEGFRTAAFFSKSKLKHLIKPGTLDHAEGPRHLDTRMATETVEAATRYIRAERPNLLFVHIAEPDYAGHSVGWMSFAYGWAVRRADGAVAQLLRAAEAAYGAGNYAVIVTADHGGHGRDHGTDHVDDMQIPWIAWGAGVEPGAVGSAVKTTDTAATVLWLLGVAAPPTITGRAVTAAYTPAAQFAAAQQAGAGAPLR